MVTITPTVPNPTCGAAYAVEPVLKGFFVFNVFVSSLRFPHASLVRPLPPLFRTRHVGADM